MEWVILLIINWALFLLLVDWKALKVNIWGGVFTVCMQIFVDTQFIAHNLYAFHNQIICIFGSSLLFEIGPVFVIGVLFTQYHPVKKWAIIINLAVVCTLFTFIEYFLVKRNVLEYINWHMIDSIGVNIAAIGLLSWVCIVVFDKRRDRDS